jgi:hypothetical protein
MTRRIGTALAVLVIVGTVQVKDGEMLFSSHGCADCHTLAAGNYKGRLGPRLDAQSQEDRAKAILGNIVTS